MDSLLELFCDVDDYCQFFVPNWRSQLLSTGEIQRQRKRSLSISEIMTILIRFHQSTIVISKLITPSMCWNACTKSFQIW
jgi:hypothetical protein